MPEVPKDADDNYTRYTVPESRPLDSLPLPGRDIKARPVVSTVLTFLHVRFSVPVFNALVVADSTVQGKGSADNDSNPRRIPQPAMTKRQEGHMYTKVRGLPQYSMVVAEFHALEF